MSRSSLASDRWRQIITRQQASGVPVGRYCRAHRVAASSFFAWKRRLAGGASPAAAVPPFVPVLTPALPAASGGPVELHLAGGRRLVLRPGFDPQVLRSALVVLEGQSEGRP